MTTEKNQSSMFLILALRLNLLTPDQIDIVVAAWSSDPGVSMEQLCVEKEFLTSLDCQVIRSMIACLDNNESGTGGQIDLSKLAPDSSRFLSRSWDCLRTELPGATAPVEVALEETKSFRGELSEKGRFQVVRALAKGGLGEVFIARDTELNREVALKTIRQQNEDDPDSQSRFILEAEVTARLEHPGIVPVYGFGVDEDKRPFYAMRYIQGRSLKDEAGRFFERESTLSPGDRAVEFRKHVNSFVDICQAISYAHSRGVLHRDIKPSNVVVGRFGQTLVVDWGLAKIAGRNTTDDESDEPTLIPISGSSVSKTIVGTAIGTPAYMSPEQAAGAIHALDAKTDVYSLGATLYFLLTGAPPFAPSHDILNRIQNGDFDSPTKLKSDLSPPLVAICLKAMEKESRNRYASASELAADIERWLADEPVTAYEDRRVDRWRRAYRRNPRFYHLGIATIVLAMVGSAGAAMMLGKKNSELQQSGQLVKKERDSAVTNYTKARELAFELMTIQERELTNVPGKVTTRRKLAERVNSVMESFYEQDAQNIDVRKSYAYTSRVLANLYRMTGRRDESEVAIRRALELIESVASLPEASSDAKDELAFTLIDFGTLKTSQGRLTEGANLFRRAGEMARSFLQDDPSYPMFARTAAKADQELALNLWEVGEVNHACEAAGTAAAYFEKRFMGPDALFDDVGLWSECVSTQILANMIRGEMEEAESLATKAVATIAEHQQKRPTNDQIHCLLRARLLQERVLAARNPSDPSIGARLAEIRHNLEQLVENFAGIAIYRKALAECQLAQAESATNCQELKEAAILAAHASDQFEPFAKGRAPTAYRATLADIYALQAKIASVQADWKSASQFATRAHRLQQAIADANEESRHHAQKCDELARKTQRLPQSEYNN